MDRYITHLEEQLETPDFYIMQSNGGTIRSDKIRSEPVRAILSGPAGGVVGAQFVANAAGFEKIITFDMGGTSTDVSLCEGEIRVTHEGEIGGLPIRIPLVDVHTVGSGGGSIARVDMGGVLRVGPDSAGADPGPGWPVVYAEVTSEFGIRPWAAEALIPPSRRRCVADCALTQ